MSNIITVGVLFGLFLYVLMADHLSLETRAAGAAIFALLIWTNAKEVR